MIDGGAILAALVLIGVAVALVYPLFRPPLEPVGEPPGPAARLATLEDRKASIYGSIRDLGHDFRMDKLTEDDYRRESETLKQEAVAVLAEIDRLRHEIPRGEAALEARIALLREQLQRPPVATAPADDTPAPAGVPGTDAAAYCTACGRRAAADDRFCAACGEPLGSRP